MAMTDEEKAQAAALRQAEKDEAARLENPTEAVGRKANPDLGGESFSYGEVVHDQPVNTGLPDPTVDRQPADDFAYLSAKPSNG